MGRALQVISGFVTAPSTTLTALTMASGDSLTVRSFNEPARAFIITCWNDNQTAGILRIRSPRLHDAVQGIRLQAPASECQPLYPIGAQTPLESQDTLVVELSGSATAGDIESAAILAYYEDLPGVAARFISPAELQARGRHVAAIENTLSLGTTGGYSGEEAINAEFDTLKANKDYALLGMVCSAECLLVGYRGSDTGNLRVAVPGNDVFKDLTSRWFIRLSELTGIPLIPVFNASNKGSFLIDGMQDENGTDTTVSTIVCELD